MTEFSLYSWPHLYLKEIPPKGRGVFSREAIEAGTVIEIAPAVVFNETDAAHIDQTILYNYYFSRKFLNDEMAKDFGIADKSKAGIIVFGCVISFCNHSDDFNAKIETLNVQKDVQFILRALKKIQPHEEILISYGKLWFEAVS